MESCYKDAQSLEYTNSYLLSLWVDEVNQLASESRDLIQKYLDEVASSKSSSSQSGCFVKVITTPLHMICSIKPHHEVSSGIDSLMQKMGVLGSNLQVFGFGLKVNNGGVYGKSSSNAEETGINNVIGLDKYVVEVVEELLDMGGENSAVVLYGPRGVGKTALARMVCQNRDIRKSFNGLISWIRVSRGFRLRDVLERIFNDLNGRQSAVSGTEKQLVNELRKTLQERRCLVVLDDLWSTDLLDYLRSAFATWMHSGSKLLLTTSLDLKELAQFANAKAFESPKPLNSEESLKLLQMTLGRRISTDPEMMSIGGEMLKNCKGLPSDIVMLGTLLKDKAAPEEWITTYLSVDHPLRTTSNALQSSYNKVPNHLKPCLLHLGNFPEEYEISAARLLRMWIAEGFVPSSNLASGSKKSMEDLASDYLNELAEQYFVVVTNRGSNLRIKTCLLHDLVRDFCLRKAQEQGFLSIIDGHVDPEDSSSSSPSIPSRMAIHLDDNFNSSLLASNIHREYSAYLKSLIIFPMDEHMESNYDKKWLEYAYGGCTRLKVLDLEGLGIYGSFPRRIDNMVFLRYLSLKGTRITNVPSSIGNLRYLQTLDLRVSYTGEVVIVPSTISEITMLIFLFLPAISYEIESKKVLILHSLSNLETFKNLDASKCQIHDLLGLTKMRRLSLKTCEKDTLKVLLESPVTFSRFLQRLSLVIEGNVISQEPSILSSCGCLYRLNVEGKISIPLRHNIFPPYLEVLMLESSNLENDPMPILGYLPNLRRLCLGKDSFLGEMMTCCADGFVQLRELTLRCLPNSEKWILEVGALHVLKQLLIDKCDRLLTLPDHFPTSVLVTRKFVGGEIQEYVS